MLAEDNLLVTTEIILEEIPDEKDLLKKHRWEKKLRKMKRHRDKEKLRNLAQ